jgi:hypothetical protein
MKTRKYFFLVILACVSLTIQGCTTRDATGNISSPPGDEVTSNDVFTMNPVLEEQITSAENTWLSLGINDYMIEVTAVDVWNFQTHKIQVQNGDVLTASASCLPSPKVGEDCEVQPFEAIHYTVQGLFRYARTEARRDGGVYTEIEFDPTYGFPMKIRYDNPQMVDEEFTLLVIVFEPLE